MELPSWHTQVLLPLRKPPSDMQCACARAHTHTHTAHAQSRRSSVVFRYLPQILNILLQDADYNG